MMSAKSNRQIVADAIDAWRAGDGAAIFKILADDVRWTVTGHTAISRIYTSRGEFFENAIRPLSARIAGKIMPEVVNILADGDHVVLQWNGSGVAKTGAPYNNQYCWVMRFEDGEVKEGMAYLDTELVSELMR